MWRILASLAYIYIYIYIDIDIYIYIYIHTYIYIYTYTNVVAGGQLICLSFMLYTNRASHYPSWKTCTPCVKAETKQYQSGRSYMLFISDPFTCVQMYMTKNHTCTNVSIYTHLQMHIWIYFYICDMCMDLSINLHICIYVHLHIHHVTRMPFYVCTHVYTFLYTFLYTPFSRSHAASHLDQHPNKNLKWFFCSKSETSYGSHI